MAGVVLEYEKIIDAIGNEIQAVWNDLIADSSTSELISNIKSIEVSDEQLFRKQEENRTLKRGTIYLVVRFSAGAINYGSTVTPISIYGLGTANQVKPVQLLLSAFASKWTTLSLAKGLINADGENLEIDHTIQVWNTPEVISNFNNVDDDFRNLYRVTGSVLVGPSAISVGKISYYFNYHKTARIFFANDNNYWTQEDVSGYELNAQSAKIIEGYFDSETENVTIDQDSFELVNVTPGTFLDATVTFDAIEGVIKLVAHSSSKFIGNVYVDYTYSGVEKINIMSFQDGYRASMDSQPFGNTDGFVKSEVNFSTYSFSVSTYLLNSNLARDLQAIRGFRKRNDGIYELSTSTFKPNDYMKIGVDFSNGYTNVYRAGETPNSDDPVAANDFYGLFKVVDSSISQPLGNIPSLTVTWSR